MKKQTTLFIAFLLLCPFVLLAQQTGKVYDNLSVPSKILKSDRKYAVYLPPGYETSERSYPILYLLHGAGDDHAELKTYQDFSKEHTFFYRAQFAFQRIDRF